MNFGDKLRALVTLKKGPKQKQLFQIQTHRSEMSSATNKDEADTPQSINMSNLNGEEDPNAEDTSNPRSKWSVILNTFSATKKWKKVESEADRRRKWQNRRLRLMERKYGGHKTICDSVDADQQHFLPRAEKPTFLDYTGQLIQYLNPWSKKDVVDSNVVETVLGRDESPREYGVGLAGNLLQTEYNDEPLPTFVRQQMDEMEDYRPFFTYWITTVQIIVMITTLCWYSFAPFGVELTLKSDFVFTESLSYQQVAFYQPSNFWLGPSPADVIHLGAVFAPCMRHDRAIKNSIAKIAMRENVESGCCVRNDGSGCLQTTVEQCSTVLSTFYKWTPKNPGPGGRVRGPVCGQDPGYCTQPASKLPNEWGDDLGQWPICASSNASSSITNVKGLPEHMSCKITAKPCCIGIHGRCEMRSKEYCQFVGGHFHPEANLCSQVSCMQDVCGMFSFADQSNPDQVYRLWTSLFLHAGLVHLTITILVQAFIMRDLERLIGPWRLALLYFGAGIMGNAASAIFVPHRAESGPSGSHFGLIASLFIEVVHAWPLLKCPGFAIGKLSLITLLLLFLGFLPWVDNYAHIFGFLGGLLLSLALFPYIQFDNKDSSRMRHTLLRVGASTIFVGILTTLITVFYLKPDFQCQACKLLSCIPLTPTFCAGQNIDFATETTMAFF